jgi:hypothetical protein
LSAPTAAPTHRLYGRRAIVLVVVGGGLIGAVLGLVTACPPGQSDQVFLDAADSAGTNPFLAGVTVTPAPPPAANLPTPPLVARTGPGEATYPGTTPGLYGGTQNASTCNTDQIIAYLETNPDQAAVWAGVLGIEPVTIRSYLTGLTPVVLRTSTRVTSFGLGSGRAIPSQVVLQAGTSVLVEASGLPRVRCGSGNPLAQPRAVSPSGSSPGPRYRGTPWPGFSPATVIVIAPTTPIGAIIIVDLGNGLIIIRQPGALLRDGVVAVLPALLRPGDPVVITGRQFPPGTPVTIVYDVPNLTLAVVNSDGAGIVSTTVGVPAASSPGLHLVTAEGGGARNVLPIYVLPPGA